MISPLRWLRSVLEGWRAPTSLRARARASGDPFRSSPYFALAESDIDDQWERLIWPVIRDLDHRVVLDLAAGHGRSSARLLETAGAVVLVDINPSCLEACRVRFRDEPRVRFVPTDGYSLRGIDDGSITLVYCFDAMVHFAPEVVVAYLAEIARVLEPGGHAFLHHSNYAEDPVGDFRDAPHWRNWMSLDEMARLAAAVQLSVAWSSAIDWGTGEERYEALDGLTLLRRPDARGVSAGSAPTPHQRTVEPESGEGTGVRR